MTVAYDCTVNLGEYDDLTATDLDAVTAALDKERYEWYLDEDTLTIQGECDVDDYAWTADDVAEDIKWLLRDAAEIDADVETREVEYEPDWDAIFA